MGQRLYVPSLDLVAVFEIRGSLLTRTTVVFAVAASAIVLIALVVINAAVVRPLMAQAAMNKATTIELAAKTYFELPSDRRAEYELQMLVDHGLVVSSVKQDMPLASWDATYFSMLRSALMDRLGSEVSFFESEEHYWVNIPNPVGEALELQIGFTSELPYLTQQIVGIVVLIVTGVIVLIASYNNVRRIARPLERASYATERFRGANDFNELPIEGPQELQTLAANLNRMAHDITELLENRTALLAGISHDIRTPLTRMRLALELHKDRVDPEVSEQLSHDLSQIDVLVDNALEYAQGTQETPERIPLHSFLMSLVDGIGSKMEMRWEGEREVDVEIAPGAFSRVLTNLVENAVEYGKEASLNVVVGTSGIAIHVLDKGRGIPDEYKERVFHPFYRLDEARGGSSAHSGLGLAIVKQLCETFGWEIELNSHEGCGSDFCVRIPR